MTTARVQSVLVEADGPLLLIFRDVVDCAWLGLATRRGADGDDFLCVPVSASRLAAFRHGELDLRAMFTTPEVSGFARAFIPAELGADASLDLRAVEAVSEEWLPDEGFLLTTFTGAIADDYKEMSAVAGAHNRPIVYLNLNPPEARVSPKIDASRLGVALELFQNSLQRAHALVTKALSLAERKARVAMENYTLEVFSFAPGSFEVRMQSKMEGDIFGHSPHVLALAKLDELASVVEDPTAAVAVAQANRGHFVSAFQELLKFVATNDTPITYAWTEPRSTNVQRFIIRPEPAQVLYETLISKQELSQQDALIVGVFRKLDVDNRAWTLLTAEGEEFRGTISEESGVTLSGLDVDSTVYSLACRDILLETVGSGRQTSRLELLARPVQVRPAV